MPIFVIATGWQQTLSRDIELLLRKPHIHLLLSALMELQYHTAKEFILRHEAGGYF